MPSNDNEQADIDDADMQETVARQLKAAAESASAKAEVGISKPAKAPTGSGPDDKGSKPAKAPTGSRSLCGPFPEVIQAQLGQRLSARANLSGSRPRARLFGQVSQRPAVRGQAQQEHAAAVSADRGRAQPLAQGLQRGGFSADDGKPHPLFGKCVLAFWRRAKNASARQPQSGRSESRLVRSRSESQAA